jgi:hypothetical protein
MKLFEKKPVVTAVNARDLALCDFIVLGACCQRSLETFDHLKEALVELGIDEQAANTGDNLIIAQYGVMRTPALVIKQKVVMQGKYLSIEEIKTLIKENYHD